MSASKPVIIIKKNGGHGGHHGGAWKVAYADFVTAMMSLFIVLWLMNSSVKVRQAVAGYFNDPRGKSTQTGSDQVGTSDSLALTEKNIPELKQKIEEAIRKMNDLKALQNQIQITITPEGLRIELLETKDGTFFNTGSATLNQNGREMLQMLAGQLGGVPNRVSIEGHTDAQPYASTDGYGNWELSADRANAARRLMQSSGLREDQVSQVRGYADQKLRVPSNPMDPSNRRISLIVQYLTVDAPPVPENAGTGPPGADGGAAKAGNGGPSLEIPAPGSAARKPGAAPSGAAKDGDATGGDAKSGGRQAPPSGSQPSGARSDPAQTGPAQNGAGQRAPKTTPAPKPSAGNPLAAKPAAGNPVSRLWQKIHPK
jgi:chemotaxis protein MotB